MHAVSYLALGALDKPLRLTQLFGHGQVTWKKQTQLTCSNSTEGTVDEDPLLPTRQSSGKVSGRSAASLSELTMEQNETKTVATSWTSTAAGARCQTASLGREDPCEVNMTCRSHIPTTCSSGKMRRVFQCRALLDFDDADVDADDNDDDDDHGGGGGDDHDNENYEADGDDDDDDGAGDDLDDDSDDDDDDDGGHDDEGGGGGGDGGDGGDGWW